MPGRRIRIGWGGAPSWFPASASAGSWVEIPGTAAGTLAAAGAQYGATRAWTSYLYDKVNRDVYSIRAAGHNDPGDNATRKLSLAAESCAWTALNTGSGLGAASPAINDTGACSDGSASPDHNYNLVEFVDGEAWFLGYGAMASSLGESSTAVWRLVPANVGNSTKGFEYIGLMDATYTGSGSQGTIAETGCDFDPTDRLFWNAIDGDATAYCYYSTMRDAPYTRTRYLGPMPYFFVPNHVRVIDRLRIALLIGSGGETGKLAYIDLTNPGGGVTDITANQSGTSPCGDKGMGVVFDANGNGGNGCLYAYNGGSTIYACDVPTTVGGTWAWRSFTAGGVTPPIPDDGLGGTRGTWKKLGLFPDFDRAGAGLLFYGPNYDGACYGLRVNSTGL